MESLSLKLNGVLMLRYSTNVIDNFIIKHNISIGVEFGCGDGNILSLYKLRQKLGLARMKITY